MVVGVPKDRPTLGDPALTLVEAQSHFSLWCMAQAVLVATNDVRLRDESIERILLNPETISVNQDSWSVPAARVPAPGRAGDHWARPLANGDLAVLVLNRQDVPTRTGIDWSSLPGMSGDKGVQFRVRDLQRRSEQTVCDSAELSLEPHQTAFVRLTKLGACSTPSPSQDAA